MAPVDGMRLSPARELLPVILRLALGFAALVSLAACSDTDVTAENEDLLRVAVRAMPPTQGNPFGANGPPSSYVWAAIFDGLTRLDSDGQLIPALATSWRVDGDRSWVFELRRDVRFQNGAVFDAEAVKATIDWLKSEAGSRQVIGNEIRGIERVEILGSHRIRIHTIEPDAILPNRMAAVLIPEPDSWKRLGPDGFAQAPVGTGPYTVARWDEAGGLRASRFADSWRAGPIGEIKFLELSDSSVVAQALITGELDVAAVSVESINFLEDRGIAISSAPSQQIMSIAFVIEGRPDSPLAKRGVRQALNYAVDRKAIAANLLAGLGRAAGQPAAAGTPGHDPAIAPWPYDPQRARQLLREAGYADGFPLEVSVVSGNIPADTLIYQAVEQYLRDVGIDARFNVQPFPSWLQDYLAGRWEGDAFGLSWNALPYNDVQRPLEIFSCLKRNPFYCDERVDRLVQSLAQETDAGARAAQLRVAARLYRQEAPALFLVEQVDIFGAVCRVSGLTVANRVPIYNELTIDDNLCDGTSNE